MGRSDVLQLREKQRADRDSGSVRGTNQLLDALPTAESGRLRRSFRPVFLDFSTVLFEPDETIVSVEFPLNCVVSLVSPLDGGAIVEVATVGNEGIVGVPLMRGGSLAVRAICSVAGWALRMDTSTYLNEIGREGPLRAVVDDYVLALFGHISQAAACNRLHSNEERLSRWLLMSHDRVGINEFAITHEFLGSLLGARRATVSLSAGALQAAGLIKYHRGQVTIVDRAGLEEAACECYRVIQRSLDRVVQRARRRSRPAPTNFSA
jgi:CRP-like cAMP-binding protein